MRASSQADELDLAMMMPPGARSGSSTAADPQEAAGARLRGAHSNGDTRPSCAQHLPPLAYDIRLPPLHPKQAAQLYMLAAGHGSLFAGALACSDLHGSHAASALLPTASSLDQLSSPRGR